MKLFIPNSSSNAAEQLAHYREPLCFELAGKALLLFRETGETEVLQILSDALLTWGALGASPAVLSYQCLKLKDALYLMIIPGSGLAGLVLDLKQGLAILAFPSPSGAPRLVAATLQGSTPDGIAAGSTEAYQRDSAYGTEISALIGQSIRWYCSPKSVFRTVFHTADSISLTPDKDGAQGDLCAAQLLRIRQNDYLMALHMPEGAEFTGNLLLLCDLFAVRCEGYGQLTDEQTGTLFSAFGGFVKEGQAQ